jgi:hypothetical protein
MNGQKILNSAITLTRDEAQQVLDALERADQRDGYWSYSLEIETLRARLSAPEPEPVACKQCGAKGIHACIGYRWEEGRIPPSVTFTAPPQREWQGLTDEDLSVCDEDGVILARYWEAKLREKNT